MDCTYTHATWTDTGECHMTLQKRWLCINFLSSFRGAELLAIFFDASKKQTKERALDMEAAAEMIIFFERATGV